MVTHTKKKGRGILGEIYFLKKNHTHKNTLSLINTLTLKEKKQTIYKKVSPPPKNTQNSWEEELGKLIHSSLLTINDFFFLSNNNLFTNQYPHRNLSREQHPLAATVWRSNCWISEQIYKFRLKNHLIKLQKQWRYTSMLQENQKKNKLHVHNS